jgi:hypothetical protein
MKRIIVAGILIANLVGTASAALAEGNGFRQPFYLTSQGTYQAPGTVSGTANSAAAVVAGPAPSHCPYCAMRVDNMGH